MRNNKYYKYADKATDDELREAGITVIRRDWWNDETYVQELNRRVDAVESGEEQGISWEVVQKNMSKQIENWKRKRKIVKIKSALNLKKRKLNNKFRRRRRFPNEKIGVEVAVPRQTFINKYRR